MKYQLYINAPIGWPISAQYVRSVLSEHQGKHVDVYVNSFGGSVVDALDIRQQFIDHGDITCHVFGMTASAATLLVTGAKDIKISRFALMLVHQCSRWVDTWGRMNASELAEAIANLQKEAEDLATIDQVVANIYAARSGRDAAVCAEWMKEAKWLTAEKCKEMGLVDSISEDGDETDVTDELRAQMVACGLPLPVPARDGRSLTKLDQFLAAVKNFFGDNQTESFHTEDEHETVITDAQEDEGAANLENSQTNMENNTYNGSLCSVLNVESLHMSADGHVLLSEEQLNALEAEFLQMNSVVSERDALRTQVDNLLAGDGAADADIEGDGDSSLSVVECYRCIEHLV